VSGKEPTREQCKKASLQAIDESRRELEERGIGWDYLAEKLRAELEACKTEQFLGKVVSYKKEKGKKKRVVTNRVIYSDILIDWKTRQNARMDAHKLRGDYPPEEKRIAGPGGGPISLQRLEVEFVKSGK